MSQVAFRLSDIRFGKQMHAGREVHGIAKLEVAIEDEGSVVKEKEVSLSPKLVSALKNARGDNTKFKMEGKMFISDNKSSRWTENPLRLVTFNKKNGTLNNYQVELVEEKYGTFISYYKDRQNRLMERINYLSYKSSEYFRLQTITLNK